MLYYLLYPLHQDFAVFNVFRYITFRAAYASLTALAMSLLLGPWVIRTLAAWRVGQQIRAEGPESHRCKAGTPTMGGLLILFCLAVPTLLWGRLDNAYLWLALLTTLGFGAVGWAALENSKKLEEFFQKISQGADIASTAKAFDEAATPILNGKG